MAPSNSFTGGHLCIHRAVNPRPPGYSWRPSCHLHDTEYNRRRSWSAPRCGERPGFLLFHVVSYSSPLPRTPIICSSDSRYPRFPPLLPLQVLSTPISSTPYPLRLLPLPSAVVAGNHDGGLHGVVVGVFTGCSRLLLEAGTLGSDSGRASCTLACSSRRIVSCLPCHEPGLLRGTGPGSARVDSFLSTPRVYSSGAGRAVSTAPGPAGYVPDRRPVSFTLATR